MSTQRRAVKATTNIATREPRSPGRRPSAAMRRAAARAAIAAVRRCCTIDALEPRRLLANAPIVVSTLTDELDADRSTGDLSLREAIAMARGAAGDDVINFLPTLAGTIRLSSTLGELRIDSPLTINGPGSDQLTIDGGGFTRLFTVVDDATLVGMRLVGGAANFGAGVFVGVDAHATLDHLVIENNAASGSGGGLMVDSAAGVTLSDCLIQYNQSPRGGGILAAGTLTITGTTVAFNRAVGDAADGGGMYVDGGDVTAVNSTFDWNEADSSGGAIYLRSNSSLADLTNVTIFVNTANADANDSGAGGGIYAGSPLLTIRNSIVASNSSFSVQSSYHPDDLLDEKGGVIGSYDLIGSSAGNTFVNGSNGNKVGGVSKPLNPGLDYIGNNGGPTPTNALYPDSPAIDAGSNAFADNAGLTTDQRGGPRIVAVRATVAATVDIGAYEATGAPMVVTTLQDEVDQNGTTSLREAIAAVPQRGVIEFAPGLTGTIRLSPKLGALKIDHNMTIQGPGADKLTISGENATRVIYMPFNLDAVINDVTIAKGRATSGAGLSIGPEVFARLERVVIENNLATQSGGGLQVEFDTTFVTLVDCTISHNTADHGGGISSIGSVKLFECTISDNGAINLQGFSYSGRGGGIYALREVRAVNSTISDNFADADGGGIYTEIGHVQLTNVTIAGNRADNDADGNGHGGGVMPNSESGVTWRNTIVASNTLGDGSAEDYYIGSLPLSSTVSNSLIGSNAGNDLVNGVNGNRVGTAAAPLDPVLMPLGRYGGLTETQPLRQTSPAVDAGDNAAATAAELTQDQRGAPRAIAFSGGGSGIVDLGAVEAGGAIVVNTLEDEVVQNATLSLREAIALAKQLDGDDVIRFDPSLSGTITLSQSLGELPLGAVFIQGPGADRLTISGGNRVRVFSATAGGSVRIADLRITGGLADVGAALRVQDTNVTLDHVVLDQNQASDQGGAIYAGGSSRVTLNDCFITNNVAARGGGIAFRGPGTSTSTLTLIRTTVSGNRANPATQPATGELGSGGGLLVAGGGLVAVNSTFSGNTAKNDGGGVALYAGAAADLTNATIAQNHADNDADGVGKGAGIFGGTVLLRNTILAQNLIGGANAISDVDSATLAAQSAYNLISSYPGGPLNGQNGNRFGTPAQPLDPRLLPLGDYGGPAPTHALRGDSPAIDAGSNAAAQAATATVDQRGQDRTLSFGGGAAVATVDIGAYEAAPPILVTTLDDEQTDDATLSLREALALAKVQPGWDVIRFDPTLLPAPTSAGAITLTLGSLTIDSDLELHGPAAARLTISGGDARQILRVNSGVSAVVTDLTLAHGLAQDGGAISISGDLELRNVLLWNNHATRNGGAIYDDGTLTLADVTVAQNRADQDGGGIYVSAAATGLDLTNVTVAENRADADGAGGGSGGGLRVPGGTPPSGGTFLLHNTVAAANRRGAAPTSPADDVSGQFTPESGFNFISAADGSAGLASGAGTTAGTAAAPADPRLEPLADYGGNTLTYAVKPGSPVIDAGSDQAAIDAGLTDDQRHLPRFRDGDGNGTPKVDVGAFEQQVRLNVPPRLGAINVLKGAAESVPFEISYDYLRAAADVSDPESDTISFRIMSVTAGTLKRPDGSAVPVGALIAPGDRVLWTPPAITFGNDPSKTLAAFSVVASDGKADSEQTAVVSVEVSRVGRAVNYAVLFSGGIDPDNNQSYYYDNVRRMYQTLLNDYGLDPDNIYVIYAGGAGTPDRPGNVTSDLTFGMGDRAPRHLLAATRANLSSTLAGLGSRVDDNDHFLFWAFDHGLGARTDTTRKGEETLQGWGAGETIGVADLRTWLQGQAGQGGIRRGYSTYLFAECYAGGMLDALDVSDTDTWHAFGAASSNHYEESIEQAFAAPFTQALHAITGMTGPAFQYALAHDAARAPDLATDGGAWQLGKEHPWSKGPDFPIFAAPQTNAPLPTLTRAYPLKFDPTQTQFDITYDMLMAATDATDPSGRAVVFRLDPFQGQLLRDGVPVTQATVGYGQRVTWRPQTVTPGATVSALALRLLDANGQPIGTLAAAKTLPVRFGSPTPGPIARDDTYRVKNTATRAPIPVAANDSGASLAVVDVGQPLHGTVELVDGAVLYTPDTDFLGVDSFSYVIVSGGTTDMATVQVNVVNFDPGPQSKYLFTTTPLAPPPGWAGLPTTGAGWDWATYRQQLPAWTDSVAVDIAQDGGVVVGISRPATAITDPGAAADQAWLGGTTAAYLWQADTGAPYWRTSADGTLSASNTLMLLLQTTLQHAGANDGLTRTIYDGVGAGHFTGTSLLPTLRYLDPDNGQEGRPLNAWGGIWFDVGDDGSWRGLPNDDVARELFPLDVSSAPSNAAGSHWAAVNRQGALITRAQLWTVDPAARTLQLVRDLLLPGGDRSAATDMDAAGRIVGWSDTAATSSPHACFFDGADVRDLGTLTGFAQSTATAVNDAGDVVGFSANDVNDEHGGRAFIWSGGQIRSLGAIGGTGWSIARDVNAQGMVVGSSNGSAFLWVNGTMYNLNESLTSALPAAVTLIDASAINDAGQIAATAQVRVTDPNTGAVTLHTRAYLLELDPSLLAGQVVGRHLLYGGAGTIATDKQALMPGQLPSPANSTGYSSGITGVAVDIARPPGAAPLTLADFEFRVGTTGDPGQWQAAPATSTFSLQSGAGDGGADRVTIRWADGAIRNQWLQIRVKASPATGITQDDVFYFGNMAGDTNGDRVVNFNDLLALAKNYNKAGATVAQGDFDGNGMVDFDDLLVLAKNYNKSLPAVGAAAGAVAAAAQPLDTKAAVAAALGIAPEVGTVPAETAGEPRAGGAPPKVTKPTAPAKPTAMSVASKRGRVTRAAKSNASTDVPKPMPRAMAVPAGPAPVFSVKKIAAGRKVSEVLA